MQLRVIEALQGTMDKTNLGQGSQTALCKVMMMMTKTKMMTMMTKILMMITMSKMTISTKAKLICCKPKNRKDQARLRQSCKPNTERAI